MWSVRNSEFQHARCCSASARRSIPAALDFFSAIPPPMPLLVCCLGTWPHVYVWGVTPLLPVKYTPKVRRPYLSPKLKARILGPSVLSVTILLQGSNILSIQWYPCTMYLPSTRLRSLPLMRLWMAFMLGSLSSVLCTWSVTRLPLVVVSTFYPIIVSHMSIFQVYPWRFSPQYWIYWHEYPFCCW